LTAEKSKDINYVAFLIWSFSSDDFTAIIAEK